MAKAVAFRKLATECLEMADRMSLKSDRARLLSMAQHCLECAQVLEAQEEAASEGAVLLASGGNEYASAKDARSFPPRWSGL